VQPPAALAVREPVADLQDLDLALGQAVLVRAAASPSTRYPAATVRALVSAS
jgi:hypothetical protein